MKQHNFFFCIKVVLFSLVLCAGCVVGCLLFARPTVSEVENRTLTAFPTFSVKDFLDGTYTGQISTWYADTFPGREQMIRANQALQELYGLRGHTAQIGKPGDEIPTDDTFVWKPPVDPETLPEDESDTEPETAGEGDVSGEMVSGYYVNGIHGYQLYYFSHDYAAQYAQAVVNTAHRLDGIAQVYDIIVPLNYCFELSPELQAELKVSNGPQAISYMYYAISQLGEQAGLTNPVITLDITPTVREHLDEYLYFRTDHHWTARNAYYTSRIFLDAAGRSYPSLDSDAYRPVDIEGFTGSIYRYSQVQKLHDNPDTIHAYVPTSVDTVRLTKTDGEVLERPLVNENANEVFSAVSLYRCFVDGDYPLYEVHNPAIHDGSAVLIIKESFGNAFIPMLVDSYEYVYAVDYRFFKENLVDFVTEHNITDVLFLNNLCATADDYTIRTISRLANQKDAPPEASTGGGS